MTINFCLVGIGFTISLACKFARVVEEWTISAFFSFVAGSVSTRGGCFLSFWLVEARTSWSERFLFLRRPIINY